MVPAHVVVLDALPLTPNGKVDRKALPAPDGPLSLAAHPAAGAGTPHPGAPIHRPRAPLRTLRRQRQVPGPELEETVAGVWRAALNVGQVGQDDNFFDLGGHSLLMVQVQQQLKAALGRDLSITDLFRFPTIRSLTEHLAKQAGTPAAGPVGGRVR